MNHRRAVLPLLICAGMSMLLFPTLPASENRFDAAGMLDRIELGQGWLNLSARVRVPAKSWSKTFDFEKEKVVHVVSNDKNLWHARLGDGETVDIEIVQAVTQTAEGLQFDLVASAFKDCDIEGVIFWIDLPTSIFAGGSFVASGTNRWYGTLPESLPENHILYSAALDSVQLSNADKSIRLRADFGTPVIATLQDSRKWNKNYSLLIHAHSGLMVKGQSAKFRVTLSTAGSPDQTPAVFNIDAASTRYSVKGIGGNYCFNIESPERGITLEKLKPQFARTEISLKEWAPEKGTAPNPALGKLPREFELMRDLAQRKIPFIASIWHAPDWLCDVPNEKEPDGKLKPASHKTIRTDAWPELIDAIGAYLLHAKTVFGAEADYFSFNETDYGAHVKLTPEEHRDAIKRAGATFEKLGLKTRCLLGDVSTPRTPFSFLQPTLDDPDAMKFVSAVSFHSWGGATPEQYAAWGDLAARLKLPLIVGEAGVDPGAWKDKSYKTFDYFIREMRHYQALFQFARPQAVLYWEYTADYSLMDADPKDKSARVDTERFALQEHWLNFVLPGSDALAVTGDNDHVMLTAFRKSDADRAPRFAFQLSNTGWPRKARVTGIPKDVKTLNVVQTSRGSLFQSRASITVVDGTAEIDLAGQSMTTLTTPTKTTE